MRKKTSAQKKESPGALAKCIKIAVLFYFFDSYSVTVTYSAGSTDLPSLRTSKWRWAPSPHSATAVSPT